MIKEKVGNHHVKYLWGYPEHTNKYAVYVCWMSGQVKVGYTQTLVKRMKQHCRDKQTNNTLLDYKFCDTKEEVKEAERILKKYYMADPDWSLSNGSEYFSRNSKDVKTIPFLDESNHLIYSPLFRNVATEDKED
jgi:predicted GIY-YIG superfamily endonuclease